MFRADVVLKGGHLHVTEKFSKLLGRMIMTALQNDICPKHSFLPHSNRQLVAYTTYSASLLLPRQWFRTKLFLVARMHRISR